MTLKQALQALRDIEADDGFGDFIIELAESKVGGYTQKYMLNLTEGHKLFLRKHEMEFEYDHELEEYIINLT